MCTSPELTLSTYEKHQYKDMLGSKRIGGEELQSQGSVIKLVTRLAWKGGHKPASSPGVLVKIPREGSLLRPLYSCNHNAQKEVLTPHKGS